MHFFLFYSICIYSQLTLLSVYPSDFPPASLRYQHSVRLAAVPAINTRQQGSQPHHVSAVPLEYMEFLLSQHSGNTVLCKAVLLSLTTNSPLYIPYCLYNIYLQQDRFIIWWLKECGILRFTEGDAACLSDTWLLQNHEAVPQFGIRTVAVFHKVLSQVHFFEYS